jgi:hypothetical protein
VALTPSSYRIQCDDGMSDCSSVEQSGQSVIVDIRAEQPGGSQCGRVAQANAVQLGPDYQFAKIASSRQSRQIRQ